MEKAYKYIIINKTTDEAVIQKSVRDISDFINTIYRCLPYKSFETY